MIVTIENQIISIKGFFEQLSAIPLKMLITVMHYGDHEIAGRHSA